MHDASIRQSNDESMTRDGRGLTNPNFWFPLNPIQIKLLPGEWAQREFGLHRRGARCRNLQSRIAHAWSAKVNHPVGPALARQRDAAFPIGCSHRGQLQSAEHAQQAPWNAESVVAI